MHREIKHSKTIIYLVHSNSNKTLETLRIKVFYLFVNHFTHDGVSFLHLGKLSYSFLNVDLLLTFYPLSLQHHELPLRVPSGNFLASITFSGTSSSFSSQPLCSFTLLCSPSLGFSGCLSQVS